MCDKVVGDISVFIFQRGLGHFHDCGRRRVTSNWLASRSVDVLHTHTFAQRRRRHGAGRRLDEPKGGSHGALSEHGGMRRACGKSD